MSIPTEITTKILSNLSINDIENTMKSSITSTSSGAYLGTGSCCNDVMIDKMNPIKYLGKTFNNPEKLLYEMGKFNMILSGSRALDYFIEGYASLDSDWNFYCDCTLTSVYGSFKALEAAGVVWHKSHDVLRTLSSKLLSPQDGKSYDTKGFEYVFRYIEMSDEELNNLSDDEINEQLLLINDNLMEYDTTLAMVHGHICLDNNKIQNVNIKFSDKHRDSMDLIMQCKLSALQCFISFAGAGHLYYEAAMNNISYYWMSGEDDTIHAIVSKCTRQGFKCIRYHDKGSADGRAIGFQEYEAVVNVPSRRNMILEYNKLSSVRSLSDSKSKFIPFTKYYNQKKIRNFMDTDKFTVVARNGGGNNVPMPIDIMIEIKEGTMWYQLPWTIEPIPNFVQSMYDDGNMQSMNAHTTLNYVSVIATESNCKKVCNELGIHYTDKSWLDPGVREHVHTMLHCHGVTTWTLRYLW